MPAGEVHVWWAALDVREAEVQRAAALLTSDEVDRAGRFVFPLHRRRWIACRALLRRVLAEHLGVDPRELRFGRQPAGKPVLAHPRGGPGFNVSHSEGHAAFAVADGDVGIDLEMVRPLGDLGGVATQFFSPAESEELRALPESQRLRSFYECWTRKEAFLKATGEGMARPLDSFSVTLGPGRPPRILHTRPDAEERLRWTLTAFEPLPDAVAALAMPAGASLRSAAWRPAGIEDGP